MLRHVLLAVAAVLGLLACGSSRPHTRTGPPTYADDEHAAATPGQPEGSPGEHTGTPLASRGRTPRGSPGAARPGDEESLTAGRKPTATRSRATAAPRQRLGERIAGRASRLVGVTNLRTVSRSVPDDCTGLVRLAYTSAGIDLMAGPGRKGENGVTHIYRAARRTGALHRQKPRPGDLVFFRETYDRDADGRRDDGLTHVGVVERVDSNGLVTFVHRGSKGIARARMHLRQPRAHRERGEVLNDYLRRASRKHRAYLTGELFAGFASPEPLAATLAR